MKTIGRIILICAAVLAPACTDKANTDKEPVLPLTLSVDKSTIESDGQDIATLIIKDAEGMILTEGKNLNKTAFHVEETDEWLNGILLGDMANKFTSLADGSYTISGMYAGKYSYSASKSASFDVTTLYGEYWETYSASYPTPGTTVIEASDKSDYDLKITFFKPMFGTNCDVAYGKVNSDGTVITIDAFTSNFFGPCSSFTINVDGTNLSGKYAGALDYTAMKK